MKYLETLKSLFRSLLKSVKSWGEKPHDTEGEEYDPMDDPKYSKNSKK